MGWIMVCKIVWNDYEIVWICKIQGGINSWDLTILYRDYKSWKKYNEMGGIV